MHLAVKVIALQNSSTSLPYPFPPMWLLEAYAVPRSSGYLPSADSKPNCDDEAQKLWTRLNLDPSRNSGKPQPNYDDEARKLWARLNLDSSQSSGKRWNPLDAIWCHPETGAKIYVGNEKAAKNSRLLQEHNITHIVNCTDSIPNYHENQTSSPCTYMRFDICLHHSLRNHKEAVLFAQPMLDFISSALLGGNNVMVHCLAGAHRAGTTGIICLMHFAKFSKDDAIAAAKQCRPIIEPIGDFPSLLARLEMGWRQQYL